MFEPQEIMRKSLLRAAEIKKERLIRRRRILFAVSTAASLTLIAGLSFILKNLVPEESAEAVTAEATLIAGSNFGSYVLIGVIGFAAGAAVAIIALKKAKKD